MTLSDAQRGSSQLPFLRLLLEVSAHGEFGKPKLGLKRTDCRIKAGQEVYRATGSDVFDSME